MKAALLAMALTGLYAGQLQDPTAFDYVGRPLPEGEVTLPTVDGKSVSVKVEIAATTASRSRGLMWRRELAEGRGMLFIFPEQEVHSFWMRNTLIPLDMLFIDESLQLVGIVENAVPRTLTSRRVEKPSVYVLEVPAGWSKKHGVKAGVTVKMTGTSMLAVQ